MAKIIDSTNLGYLIGKIKAAFWPKSDVVQIDIDSTPTDNSTNLVTSGGVKDALDDKQAVISDLADIRAGAALGATALQSYTETDPTVPSWAKASSKPTYTAQEVGALPSTTVIPSAPGTLNTDNSTAQTASSSESLAGTIKLHKVSKTGSYSDLNNKPTIPDELADLADDSTHRLVTDTEKATWNGKSNFSGNYNDLTNKPTIPSAPGTLNTTATSAQSTSSSEALSGNITLHKVSKTGSYSDLNNKPTIPDELADLSDDSTHRLVTDTEKSTWNAKSDFSGSYNDLTNKPTIPSAPGTLNTTASTAQSTSSSEALSGNITLHKVSKTGSYEDLNNKPTIPTVPTISTDISADATSNTKTASPKAVKDYVDANASGDAVKYTQQSLTDAQKAQARANIGAEAELETESVNEVDLETPVETSYPSGGFRPNKIYDLGTLTGSQTFALYTTSLDTTVKNEWVWSFVTGSTAPQIQWPSGITWDGGSAPTVNASCLYEISVRLIGSYYVGYYKEIALS